MKPTLVNPFLDLAPSHRERKNRGKSRVYLSVLPASPQVPRGPMRYVSTVQCSLQTLSSYPWHWGRYLASFVDPNPDTVGSGTYWSGRIRKNQTGSGSGSRSKTETDLFDIKIYTTFVNLHISLVKFALTLSRQLTANNSATIGERRSCTTVFTSRHVQLHPVHER